MLALMLGRRYDGASADAGTTVGDYASTSASARTYDCCVCVEMW